jgi:hypothetical protein
MDKKTINIIIDSIEKSIKAKQEIIERLNDEIKRNEDDLVRFNDIKRELNK